MVKQRLFYKAARLNGFDFYTAKTINYREAIGKTVLCPNAQNEHPDIWHTHAELCSNTVIHASHKPNDVFVGAKIPCSVYRVRGTPVIGDETKSGFKELFIIKEIPQGKLDKLFGWKYSEASNPVNPLKIKPPMIGKEQKLLLKKWDSVWASVWAYFGSLFPNVKKWKYVKYRRGEYPFQSAVDLWKQGLVASFDGSKWQLHGNEKADVLFEISVDDLKNLVI